ncbi:MAG: glycosyltransferase family 2 protein [Candidatus Daviesbacteria bacterium]|nr:glycosyltransferase family 2 protein [Candidatus Daviesbacteria bacterium]
MRILLALILGFALTFFLCEGVRRLTLRFPSFKKYSFRYSLPGFVLLLGGIIVGFINYNSSNEFLVGLFFSGAGFGLITYHLLARQYVLREETERRFIVGHQKQLARFMEALPGLTMWTAITSPLWLSFTLPFAVAYLIILADIYWLISGIKVAVMIFLGYKKMEWAKSQDWITKLKTDFPDEWKEYYHLIVIPSYKESLEVLNPVFEAIANSDYPKDKIFLAVGFEAWADPDQVTANIKALKDYENTIGGVLTTIHQLGTGEVKGPATNRNYIIRQAVKYLQHKTVPQDKVIVTTLDADFVIHPRFLAGALHKYLSTPIQIRDKRTYTGVFLYYNNYWQAPTPMRLIAAGTSFWQLAEMYGSDKYRNFASMSINLKPLLEIGLWMIDKVNDDSGFYWKAYYHFNGDYKVIPHFMPINGDTVLDVNLAKTFQNQYLQQKRWAYGAEHIPYAVQQYFNSPETDFWDKTDKLFFAIWGYVKWGMLALFVSFAGLLIPIINPSFSQSVVAYNLPVISSWILTVAFLGMFATIYVHEKTVPKRPANWSKVQKLWSYIQWVLVPIIMVTISALPVIDALTTLMLGKRLEFRVTNKARIN